MGEHRGVFRPTFVSLDDQRNLVRQLEAEQQRVELERQVCRAAEYILNVFGEQLESPEGGGWMFESMPGWAEHVASAQPYVTPEFLHLSSMSEVSGPITTRTILRRASHSQGAVVMASSFDLSDEQQAELDLGRGSDGEKLTPPQYSFGLENGSANLARSGAEGMPFKHVAYDTQSLKSLLKLLARMGGHFQERQILAGLE